MQEGQSCSGRLPSFWSFLRSVNLLTDNKHRHVFAIHANEAYKLTCWEMLIWFRKTLCRYSSRRFEALNIVILLLWTALTTKAILTTRTSLIMQKVTLVVWKTQTKRRKAVLVTWHNQIFFYGLKWKQTTKLLSLHKRIVLGNTKPRFTHELQFNSFCLGLSSLALMHGSCNLRDFYWITHRDGKKQFLHCSS